MGDRYYYYVLRLILRCRQEDNGEMPQNDLGFTTVIAILVAFIVFGTVGTFVGSAIVQTMNLSSSATVTNYTHQSTAPSTVYGWTVPLGVSHINFVMVGAGGGGGSGNSTSNKGGENGTAGQQVTQSSVAVTAGSTVYIKHGKFGVGGDGPTHADGTAGGNTSVTIGATLYNALGGKGGFSSNSTNATSTQAGMPGAAGYGSTGSSAAGEANTSYAGGAVGAGFGAGGGGGASANWPGPAGTTTWVDGSGGAGENGATVITYISYVDEGLYASQTSIIDTFELGIVMCRILVIISIIVLIWLLLQKAGIIPRMAPGIQWGAGDQGRYQ